MFKFKFKNDSLLMGGYVLDYFLDRIKLSGGDSRKSLVPAKTVQHITHHKKVTCFIFSTV